jgi:hypothetical protein
MFGPHFIIDSVQDAKKVVVEKFVPDGQIKDFMFAFVEAQRIYTKTLADITLKLTSDVAENLCTKQYFSSAK